MIRLIKGELKKIFKKKSFLIVTFIFIFYSILTNVIYRNIDDYVYTSLFDIEELESINKDLNLDDINDLYEYIDNLSLIEIEQLKSKYNDANQQYLFDNYLYDVVYDLKENEFITKDVEIKEELENKYDIFYTKIKNNDYKYFINREISELNEKLNNTTDEKYKNIYEILIKLNEYKLNNDVSFDEDNYLYQSIEAIAVDLTEYYNLKNKTSLTKDENERLNYLDKEMLINKYILENKVDVENGSNLNAVLRNFANEFGLFILIYVVMISGGIVSEEFNKGTIKFLLTKPYKRRTILTSKLVTILILIPLIIIFMSVIEVIIGGLVLGFKSLSIPVLLYNASSKCLVEVNILKYLALTLISNLPIYLILSVFCFMLSTITISTSAAITVTFLFYLISNVISSLALNFNLKIFKIFISLYWDFSYLVNYTESPYNVSLFLSFIVIAIYLVIMLILAYFIFDKKDVKNV